MKLFKKLASFILAFAMVMAIAMPSVVIAADDNGSITITGAKAKHTFEAYQIFAGKVSGNTLSDIKWGSGVSDEGKTKFGDAKEKAKTLNNDNSKVFAYEVSGYLTTPAASANTQDASGNYVISELEPGYYLVKDKGPITGQDSYTKFILQVVGDKTVAVKNNVPESYKKVKDTNDTTGETTNWQDSADWDIGDKVPFQLTGTVASDYKEYKAAYQLVFHDTLSAGLTFDKNSVKVYTNDSTNPISADQYTVTYPATDEHTFDVTIKDVKALDGTVTKIRVEYEATLNENAVIGSEGNPNTMYMEFSNNPNNEQGGETGKTPEDEVIVFTYKTIINKVNPDRQPLEGAEFKLEKKVGNKWEEKAVVKNGNGTTFSFEGLDDGDYRLTETKTPEGYNTMNPNPLEFKISATHEETAVKPKLLTLSGNPKSGDVTFESSLENGSLTTNIVNKSGSSLPETGGMGTTVLYAAGTLMILAAAAFLVMKKKAESK